MPYILEKISSEDKEKILNDANRDLKKRQELIYQRYLENPNLNWAVDRDRDFYMFSAPVIVRPETLQETYFMFFKGTWYDVNVESMFGNRVSIAASCVPASPLLTELQSEIIAAFAVYGRGGSGPLNKFGKPEFAIVPEFTVGAKA